MGIQVVSFHCTLKNSLGRVLSSTFNQDVITQASGDASLLRGLAEGLQDLHKGERRNIFLRADQAYGFYDPKKVITRTRDEIPESDSLRMGETVVIESGPGERMSYRVVEISHEHVALDCNHPLAGQDLIFEIEAVDAREATAEEIRDAEEPETEAPAPGGITLH